jgi:uncharacterized membrane protein YidH (DUF202 family)
VAESPHPPHPPHPPPPPPPDSGLAEERTALAWNRSGLAVVVCVAVLLRHVWPLRGTDHELALGLIALAVVVWAVLLAILTRAGARRGAAAPRGDGVFRLMTAGTLLLALVGFVAAFAAP